MQRALFSLLVLTLLLLAASDARAQDPVPHTLSFQGRLASDDGTPIDDPNATLTFRLFSNPDRSGPIIWAETQTGVAITDGVFAVSLGSQTPFPNTFTFDAQRYLSVAVGDGSAPQLDPLIRLDAAPYARGLALPLRATGSSEEAALLVTNGGDGHAVQGTATATSGTQYGLYGVSASGAGVFGAHESASGNAGLLGSAEYGVFGRHAESGAYGYLGGLGSQGNNSGAAVYGFHPNGFTAELGSNYYGGRFQAVGENALAYLGMLLSGEPYAGYFDGDVKIIDGSCNGCLTTLKVDHPEDPENRYLVHSPVQSDQFTNVYSGVVVLGGAGEAEVALPSYFGAFNRDLRYQLTAVGVPMPGLYVAERVTNNRFRIAGGVAGAEVSWEVTGTRRDAWAEANPLVAEEAKSAFAQGTYLHPEAHGVSPERGYDARVRARLDSADR